MNEPRSFRLSPSSPLGPASGRRMFYLLLPAGIWLGTLIPSILISMFGMDDRNLGGACIVLVLAPFALCFGILAVVEAWSKAGGPRAFLQGAVWNAILVAGISTMFWILSRR